MRRWADGVVGALLLVASLGVTAASNRAAGLLLIRVAPDWSWVATAAIPSCAAIATMYVRFGDPAALWWPVLRSGECRRAARLAAVWLATWIGGGIVAAVMVGGWITYARGAPLLLAFLLFGPVGEELLFRGLLWDRLRVAGAGPGAAAVLSTLAFSAHHLSLHPDSLGGLALAQVAFAVPMGLVLARLRAVTGSLWPPLLVHVASNLPFAFG